MVERKQQKRCPSGGGKSNVEMLVLPKRNDIKVVVGWGGGGGEQAEHNKSEREIKEK